MLQGGVGGYTAAKTGELLELFAGYAARPLDVSMLLDRVGLRDVASIQVRRLSGGQQQRLSLALSLVGRPELVFLDEPTAGMDPQARHATWGLLRELRAAGVTVVLTTHFLDEAEQLADSVVVVDAGRVVAAGTPAQLTRHGAEGQIRVRVSMGLRVTELREALPPGTRVAEQGDGRYLVTGEVTPQLLATLTAWLASQNILAEELAVERRSLEDVFLDLTGRAVRA
jgi:ABC-2 type transport system ATP-binding protein